MSVVKLHKLSAKKEIIKLVYQCCFSFNYTNLKRSEEIDLITRNTCLANPCKTPCEYLSLS